MTEGGIIRVEKNRNYFAASNKPFNDKRLSWAARGMMGYLLSKPTSWQLRVTDLINQKGAGRKGVRAILKELEGCGYLVRKKVRQPGGTFGWIATVYENAREPKAADGATIDGEGDHGEKSATRGPQPPHGSGVDIVSTESVSTERVTAGSTPASRSGRTPDTRTRGGSSGRTPSSRAGAMVKKLKTPKKSTAKKTEDNGEERISEGRINEVRDAFAMYADMDNYPEKGDPRYSQWRKAYKQLVGICEDYLVRPDILAIGCAMKRDEKELLMTWPGSYAKVADWIGGTLAREGRDGDLFTSISWYYYAHGKAKGWPMAEQE